MIARVGKEVVVTGMVPMHVRCNHMLDTTRRNAERPEALAHRVNDCACTLPGGDLVEAGIADESAVRSGDHPDVVSDRRHLVVWIAENIIFRALTRVRRITDCVDFVDVIHDFLPTVTPARFSTILTMAVKSLSPPNSVLVVSH